MSNYWRVRKEKGWTCQISIFILSSTAASQLRAHEATKCEDLVSLGIRGVAQVPVENHFPKELKYTRPGERLHFAMENHHAINGKIHYFYGHFP